MALGIHCGRMCTESVRAQSVPMHLHVDMQYVSRPQHACHMLLCFEFLSRSHIVHCRAHMQQNELLHGLTKRQMLHVTITPLSIVFASKIYVKILKAQLHDDFGRAHAPDPVPDE